MLRACKSKSNATPAREDFRRSLRRRPGHLLRLSPFNNLRRRAVVSSRSILLAATSSINFSHRSLSCAGSIPFNRRNTIAAIIAVRLFPSKNGWLRQMQKRYAAATSMRSPNGDLPPKLDCGASTAAASRFSSRTRFSPPNLLSASL